MNVMFVYADVFADASGRDSSDGDLAEGLVLCFEADRGFSRVIAV